MARALALLPPRALAGLQPWGDLIGGRDGRVIAAKLAQVRAQERRLVTALLDADGADPRLAELVELAHRALGEEAARWWSAPHMMLGARSPRDVALESDAGRVQVGNLLGRPRYGLPP